MHSGQRQGSWKLLMLQYNRTQNDGPKYTIFNIFLHKQKTIVLVFRDDILQNVSIKCFSKQGGALSSNFIRICYFLQFFFYLYEASDTTWTVQATRKLAHVACTQTMSHKTLLNVTLSNSAPPAIWEIRLIQFMMVGTCNQMALCVTVAQEQRMQARIEISPQSPRFPAVDTYEAS